MAHEALPKIHKSILLIGATGKIRTATFQQREHLVVPTVALVEGVIWPMNAEHPELVLFEEFTRGLQGWNGRPVVYGHPMLQGEAVSANDPKILEGWCFGQTFNAFANPNKKSLEMESWIDPVRAQIIGAQELIDRLNAGKPIEISVGVFTKEQETSGVYTNGDKYGGIWREPVPDHLAYLPDGQIGACSNDMGCGAPRVARTHLVTNRGFVSLSRMEVPIVAVETKKEEAKPKKPSFLSRMLGSMMRAAVLKTNEGETMTELFGMVSDALYANEPGFMWLDDIKPDENLAIYFVRPEDRDIMYQRKFTVDNGEVTLDAERTEVEWTRELKPVAAASAPQPTTASSCSCGGAKHAEQNTAKDDDAMKTKAERITALVDGKKLQGVTKEFLETCNDAQLTALEADAAKVTTPETTPVTPTTPTTAASTEKSTKENVEDVLKKMSEDDFLACAPKSIRDLVASERTREAAERTNLVAAMKTSQTEFTEDELKALPIEQLRKFSRVCKVNVPAVDFGGRGIPRDEPSNGDDYSAPKAIDMTARIKASRASVTK
jgi:hypothetical protein